MNRIDQTFDRLKAEGDRALVGFVTAGDPDFETSRRLVSAMCHSGLDVLELGVPFSDPTADGPVIQRASQRALAGGMRLARVIEMTERVRQETDVPIILFSYYNPILAYGPGRFYEDALAAGADGLLVVDLPPEESAELTDAWAGSDLSLVRLVAPTTPPERVRTIVDGASGFIYLISKTGVTGSDGLDTGDIASHAAGLRALTPLPICVGFGISTAEDVKAVAGVADGVVIGSAFERLIEEHLTAEDLPDRMADQVRVYKAATRPASN